MPRKIIAAVLKAASAMASLFVIQGRDQGTRFELREPIVTVGRDKSSVIQLHDTEISRRHAELRHEEGCFRLVDLDSSNGTYVNSQSIEEQVLGSGDRVQLGRTLMIFTAGEEASSEQAEGVDIVGRHPAAAGSRIVKSISQDQGSQIFRVDSSLDSPWLARAAATWMSCTTRLSQQAIRWTSISCCAGSWT